MMPIVVRYLLCEQIRGVASLTAYFRKFALFGRARIPDRIAQSHVRAYLTVVWR
jgi:hypothetical protein